MRRRLILLAVLAPLGAHADTLHGGSLGGATTAVDSQARAAAAQAQQTATAAGQAAGSTSAYGVTPATITPPALGQPPSGATVLTAAHTYLSACSATQPVQLPAGAASGSASVFYLTIRDGGTACPVYPPQGGTLEGAANAPAVFTDGTDPTLTSYTPSTWTK